MNMNLLYIKKYTQTIELKYPLIFAILCIGIGVCAWQIPALSQIQPLSEWRVVDISRTGETVQPMHAPMLLRDSLIWRRLGASQLVFSSLDGNIHYDYNWLQGVPTQWTARQAESVIYLLWQAENGDLWVAILSPTGDQLTAPILVASDIDEFKTTLLANQQLVVAWISNREVTLRTVDSEGRPLPESVLRDILADTIAFATDQHDHPILAWREGNQLFIGEVSNGELQNQHTIADIPSDQWLSDLEIAISGEQRIVVWGVSNAENPDTEQIQARVFPVDNFDSPETRILLDESIPVRWVSVDVGTGRLAMAAQIGGDWQTILLDPAKTEYEVIMGSAITGSPPSLSGNHAAWVTLDNTAQPRLAVVSKQYGTVQYPPDDPNDHWQEALRKGVKNSPYMLMWFIAPILASLFLRQQTYRQPAILAAYWISKAAIPLGLFRIYPATLENVGLASPFWTGVLTLAVIQGIAFLIGVMGWGRTPYSIRHAAFFLTDAFLTFAIFGAGVE